MISFQVEDMHVHSRFSDGEGSIQENAERAIEMGLKRLGCVDHVRRDTPWVEDFTDAVAAMRSSFPAIELSAGLEAKILNQNGDLDLPPSAGAADLIYAADHRFPLGNACLAPQEIRDQLRSGALSVEAAVASLVEATANAMLKRKNLVIAHLFSILPKVGLHEGHVSTAQLHALARAAKQTGARLEVDERWRCPSLRTTRVFYEAGVPVICSTDSHKVQSIGRYEFVRTVWMGLMDCCDD